MYVNVEFEMATAQCRDYIFADIFVSALSVSKSGYYQDNRNTTVYIIDIILLKEHIYVIFTLKDWQSHNQDLLTVIVQKLLFYHNILGSF